MLYNVNHVSTTNDAPMKTLPANLPPLPAGAVYLGLGGTFKPTVGFFKGWSTLAEVPSDTWRYGDTYAGDSRFRHYAAQADSEISKLNGLYSPAAKPVSQCLVWSPSRKEPTKTHPSRESAETEAKRLCALHPAHEFLVFERVAGFKGNVTIESI